MEIMLNEINERLSHILDTYPDCQTKKAMYYSLNAGGKRIRPTLMLLALKSYDKNYHPYIDIACALEMIHTYSLIHDDLPGMDNDDLRRGKPTCHKQFDEATAILAGDALLNEAVNIIIDAHLDDNKTIKLIKCLYQSSGLNGMIYGQQLDIENENKEIDIDTLRKIHHYKTGKLLSCPLKMAAIIANEKDQAVWEKIGFKIGLAFQIQDDVLDVIGDEKIIGKKTGSDLQNHKVTYVSLYGIEKCQELVDQLFNEAIQLLYSLRINHGLMLGIFEKIRKRVR